MNVSITGGAKLKSYISDLKRKLGKAPTTLVGVPRSAGNYEDGTHIATIAAVNEFGSENGKIPERSFLRAGAEKSTPQIRKLYEKMLPDVIDDKVDINLVQSLVGELAVGEIKELISNGISPSNAPSTVAAKGSSTPLIDTGTLRNSITYALSEPGDKVEEGL